MDEYLTNVAIRQHRMQGLDIQIDKSGIVSICWIFEASAVCFAR